MKSLLKAAKEGEHGCARDDVCAAVDEAIHGAAGEGASD